MRHIGGAIFWVLQTLFSPMAFAQSADSISLKREDPNLKSGSVYYSASKKNELVIRTNIWGAVQFPGVHYVPLGTRFLEAISIAGGPLDSADTSSISLSSKNSASSKEIQLTKLSLSKSMRDSDFNPLLRPDDIIVIQQDRSTEKLQLWLNVGTFIISAAALGLLIENSKK
jgi:hypothetical protein